MDYINLPAGREIDAIEYLSGRYFRQFPVLQTLSFEELLNTCISMKYEPDTETNKLVYPTMIFSGIFGLNCKDFAFVGIMWARSHGLAYEIIQTPGHVYLKINGLDFDPVSIITGE